MAFQDRSSGKFFPFVFPLHTRTIYIYILASLSISRFPSIFFFCLFFLYYYCVCTARTVFGLQRSRQIVICSEKAVEHSTRNNSSSPFHGQRDSPHSLRGPAKRRARAGSESGAGGGRGDTRRYTINKTGKNKGAEQLRLQTTTTTTTTCMCIQCSWFQIILCRRPCSVPKEILFCSSSLRYSFLTRVLKKKRKNVYRPRFSRRKTVIPTYPSCEVAATTVKKRPLERRKTPNIFINITAEDGFISSGSSASGPLRAAYDRQLCVTNDTHVSRSRGHISIEDKILSQSR